MEPIRVYLVDDHPLVREWLTNLLRMESDIAVIGEADDQASALRDIENLTPDVAVLDLSLKRGSGLELIKALQQRAAGTRVLVLSMHEQISDVERAMRAGARGYVMKRESTSQIVSAIRNVHHGKIFAAPDVLAQLTERIFSQAARVTNSPRELLSDRELEVFARLGAGQSTRKIGDDLGVSQKTVQTYCARIKEKLALSDAAELMQAAVRFHDTGSC